MAGPAQYRTTPRDGQGGDAACPRGNLCRGKRLLVVASIAEQASTKAVGGNAMQQAKTILVLGLSAVLCALAGPSAQAQGYPTKPVTLIVPWPAGGSTDLVLRALADATQKHLGQPIVVENKPGASGTLGGAQMAA